MNERLLRFARAARRSLHKNSPTFLIGLGIGGFFTAIYLAIQITPRAVEYLDDHAYGQFKDHGKWRDIPPKDRVKLVWPLYIPSASTALLSTVMIILGNKIHLKRTATLGSLYALSEGALQRYQDKAIEMLGERKAKSIGTALDADEAALRVVDEDHVHNVGGGTELCYDSFSGRFFYSDVEKINAAVNRFNKELLIEQEKGLNELYFELGLPGVEIGDRFGWFIDDGLLEITISAQMTKDDRSCIVMKFVRWPKQL